MNRGNIDYPYITNDALLTIPYKALKRTQDVGLSGKNYFIITFNVKSKGVIISKKLKDHYPNEMALLIKDQFTNLKVSKNSFSISIDIFEQIEELTIPFTAMISFTDPSANFGVEFKEPIENITITKLENSQVILQDEYLNTNVVSFEEYRKRRKSKAFRRSL